MADIIDQFGEMERAVMTAPMNEMTWLAGTGILKL